jgi:hypothetical protein
LEQRYSTTRTDLGIDGGEWRREKCLDPAGVRILFVQPVASPSNTNGGKRVSILPTDAVLTMLYIAVVTMFTTDFNPELYRVFSAQAKQTLAHMSHKDTQQSTIEASVTFDGVTLNDSLIR